MALDASIGGASSNSYVDLASADLYFSTRLYSDAWLNAQTTEKEAALITATSRLEEDQYIGGRASSTQALSWPRYAAEKRDVPGVTGGYSTYYAGYYLATEIPKPLKDATCELALALLQSELILQQPQGGAISSLRLGPVDLTFHKGEVGILPAQVARLLRWLRIGSSGVPMVRA